VDQLAKLASLRDSGALSPDEFGMAKTALLAGVSSSSNESGLAGIDEFDDERDDDQYDLEHSIAVLRFRGAKTLSGILLAVAWIVLVFGLIGSIVIGADAASVGASPSNGVAIGISSGLSVVIFSALLAAAAHVLRLLVAIWDELWQAGYWAAVSDDEPEG
jgi:hypothetical protein